MGMKTSISGKKIVAEMKQVAKDYFKEYPAAGCVCVGVKMWGGGGKGGRATDAGERDCYVGVSGAGGRTLLKHTLVNEGAIEAAVDIAEVLAAMADQLVTYRSAKEPTGKQVVKKEHWVTHNCAESTLAFYLLKNGKRLSDITIASYQLNGASVTYKPLCHNCSQWCRNHFRVLPDFEKHTKDA